MVPNKLMTRIYNSFARNNLTVSLYGDSNQCDAVESGTNITHDYIKSPAIRDMCGRIIKLKYIKECARYGERTYNILSTFLETGQINGKIDTFTEYNCGMYR